MNILHSGLSREYFISDTFFNIEKEVFKKNWVFACHISSIPKDGNFFTFQIFNVAIIIINDQNKIRAFSNICLHRGTPLIIENQGSLKTIVCPYHSWRYNMDGTLYQSDSSNEMQLRKFDVKILSGFIFVNITTFSSSIESLEKEFNDFFQIYALENVYSVQKKTFFIKANWKLLIENFEECYHCLTIHPLLSMSSAHAKAESTLNDQHILEYELYCKDWNVVSGIGPKFFSPVSPNFDYWFGRYPLMDPFYTQTRNGKPITGLLGKLKKFDRGISSFRLYPSFYLICNSDYVISFRFLPSSVQETQLEVIWYIDNKFTLNESELKTLIEFWEITVSEDNSICERQYLGIKDHFFSKMTYTSSEDYSRNFDLWYLRQLNTKKV